MRPFFALFLMLRAAHALGASFTITTVAGSDWVGDNGAATSALLFQAEGIASDGSGNLYVSDAANHRVRKITRAGIITTVAGTGVAGYSGDGGPAAAAQLNSPYGLAFDGVGNLYIADLGNARVRRIGLDGNIATVASGLSAPRNIAWDRHDAIYISDFTAHSVYRLAADGTMSVAAGTGSAGYSGDGYPATLAQLAYPAAVAVDNQGALYIADSQNHAVRKVVSGIMSTIARAATPTGLALDGFGTLYIADHGGGQILTVPLTGAAASFNITAYDLCLAPDGYLYAANGAAVSRISFSGPSTAIAGGGSLAEGDNGPATEARLNHPSGVSADALGNFYLADRDNHRIRRVDSNGVITTIAGNGIAGNSGDYGAATSASLNSPSSVTVDAHGNLYIADTGNQRVRVVTPNGIIVPFPGPVLTAPMYALSDGHGTVYISDHSTIWEVSAVGAITAVATGLQAPRGLALDAAGDLYFTDMTAKHVRRLDTHGQLTNLADGLWSAPAGVAVDAMGNVFVADAGLNRIWRLDASGQPSVFAGSGAAWLAGDGGDALSAQLNAPWDIAPGPSGTLYVADLNNNRIRQLTPGTAATSVPPIDAVNAASLQPGPLAPGMLVDLLNTGLTAVDAPNLQITFGGTQAPILEIDAAHIEVQVPTQVSGLQTTLLQITDQGNVVAQAIEAVATAAPALFADSSGHLLATNEDGTPNSATNPVPRGSVIVFFGTGDGGQAVSATIGGYPADVLYAGPVTGYPGLLQVNARVPAGYIPPGTMSVVITAGQVASQAGVTISVN